MPHVNPPKKVQGAPEEHAAREASAKPNRDDVHEQRQGGQTQEGVVQKPSRAPAQSLIDQERGDWEGMGQNQHRPDSPAAPKPQGAPTPGANSLAGHQK